MKTFVAIDLILLAIAGVSAVPTENGPVHDIVTVGENTYEGLSTVCPQLSHFVFCPVTNNLSPFYSDSSLNVVSKPAAARISHLIQTALSASASVQAAMAAIRAIMVVFNVSRAPALANAGLKSESVLSIWDVWAKSSKE